MADALGMNVQDMCNPTSQCGAQQQQVQAERLAMLAQQQAKERAVRSARFPAQIAAMLRVRSTLKMRIRIWSISSSMATVHCGR